MPPASAYVPAEHQLQLQESQEASQLVVGLQPESQSSSQLSSQDEPNQSHPVSQLWSQPWLYGLSQLSLTRQAPKVFCQLHTPPANPSSQ